MRTNPVAALITAILLLWMVLYSYPGLVGVPAPPMPSAKHQVPAKPGPPSPKPPRSNSRASVKPDPTPVQKTRQPAGSAVYVVVDTRIPEHLYVYKGNTVILATYCNTGVAGARTPEGVFTIYTKLPSDTMSGTNLVGTRYYDPNVPWVMYFYGGCAIHGFYRARYGYPQSLGCVELPVATAARVYKLLSVGTQMDIR